MIVVNIITPVLLKTGCLVATSSLISNTIHWWEISHLFDSAEKPPAQVEAGLDVNWRIRKVMLSSYSNTTSTSSLFIDMLWCIEFSIVLMALLAYNNITSLFIGMLRWIEFPIVRRASLWCWHHPPRLRRLTIQERGIRDP